MRKGKALQQSWAKHGFKKAGHCWHMGFMFGAHYIQANFTKCSNSRSQQVQNSREDFIWAKALLVSLSQGNSMPAN
jgi:hypothetical protein